MLAERGKRKSRDGFASFEDKVVVYRLRPESCDNLAVETLLNYPNPHSSFVDMSDDDDEFGISSRRALRYHREDFPLG